MILIDIDARFKGLEIKPTSVVFDLRDANNPDTQLVLQFYEGQVEFMKNKFYQADLKQMREEIRLEFVKREQLALKELRDERDNLRMECSILTDQLAEARDDA